MVNLLKRVMADETGASATEYVILVAIVAAAVLGTLGVFAGGLSGLFTALSTKMGGYLTGIT